jgi:hypothetical protein
MTAFTLAAEVAEPIISGVANLTKEERRDLQYSPNIIRITKWRLRNLFLWEGLCVTG